MHLLLLLTVLDLGATQHLDNAVGADSSSSAEPSCSDEAIPILLWVPVLSAAADADK